MQIYNIQNMNITQYKSILNIYDSKYVYMNF